MQITKKKFVKDVFAPETAEFDFGQILEIEDKRFAGICGYIPRPLTFDMLETVKAEDVIDHIEQFVGREGVKGWRTAASTLAATMENTQWQNFVSAAKAAIRKANIGPAALADYLAKSFVPQLDDLVQKWQSRSSDKNNVAESKANAIPDLIQNGLYPDNLLGRMSLLLGTPLLSDNQKRQLIECVTKAWGQAGAARRSSIFAEARYNSMRAFLQKVKYYLNNLFTLNNALLSIKEEAGEKLNAAAAPPNPHAFVSAGQIKNYFDSVAARDHAVACARDPILAQLAESSFSLEAPPRNADYWAQQAYKESILEDIGVFIYSVHDHMNLGSLDWIVNVNPAVATSSMQDKISYVEHCIAPQLDCMAAPTLAVRPGIQTADYKFVSVPHDAPVLLQGYRNHFHAGAAVGYCAVTESEITDWVAQMKVRIGFALEDILGMDKLREDFCGLDNHHDYREGIRILGENTDYIYSNQGEA